MRAIPPCIVLAALAAAPVLAQAPTGVPTSLGADIGIFAPFENGSGGSFTGRVNADFFAWDTLGMRFAAGFANPQVGEDPFDNRADIVYLSGGLIQRIEGPKYRPYLHGGIGLYHLSGSVSGTDLGLSFGGGLQFPLGMSRLLLAPELTAHVLSGDGPRFSLALTVGIHSRPK